MQKLLGRVVFSLASSASVERQLAAIGVQLPHDMISEYVHEFPPHRFACTLQIYFARR